ncbi:MAG: glycine cleavage system protein GcvH [Candidatus Cloacimonadota bacterium]|nr:MAG: glycine cleavage system protein GcvH [Candidatus Cloacimonadota bacterium]
MVLDNLLYTETHEWVKVDGDVVTLGITDYAQHELGDIVYVELPAIGDELTIGEALGSIEAVKAVEDIISPVSGEVLEINEELEDTPETINSSAFENGWLVKVKISDSSELENLLKADAYKAIIED